MAFDRDALHVVAATAGGFTLWHYQTDDDDRHILEGRDYWRQAGNLRPFDRIMVECRLSREMPNVIVSGTVVVKPDGGVTWLDFVGMGLVVR
jgi:hypothetical protein